MPDLERRIRDGLDRLGERPDPARILEQVGRRKRHLRLMHRVQTVTLVIVVLAGVAGGTYGLSRVFGIGAPHPVPISSNDVHPTPSPSASSPSPTPIGLCLDQAADVAVASTEGAAGTIRTVWRVTNTAATACRSRGYPSMGFHTSSGWLNVQVQPGGFGDISQPPKSIVVPPGTSMYFVSYWGDVTTQEGPCQQFDRVRVTLPDNRVPAEVAASGCVNPDSVRVGPVTRTKPS